MQLSRAVIPFCRVSFATGTKTQHRLFDDPFSVKGSIQKLLAPASKRNISMILKMEATIRRFVNNSTSFCIDVNVALSNPIVQNKPLHAANKA
jgi:hypothetical protein